MDVILVMVMCFAKLTKSYCFFFTILLIVKFSHYICLLNPIGLAGHPTTVTLSSIFFVTTAPAPTKEFFPTIRFCITVLLAPIVLHSPIVTFPDTLAPGSTIA